MSNIKFASAFSIPVTQYGSQANAILGIRDSGKTYTGTKAGEELMDAGVPIIVFDPVGVWKNLRVGTKTHKGYPIIIAGGDDTADIRITPENAKDIIRAAMKARVSLIVDLFSAELANKSKWVKIVQESLDVLFYENKNHGLIHIFLEEANEFIPQRIMPDRLKVYSSVERVARMGRNSSIGMTIINQRAEEVNKAILELCALTLMHKQTGKNSLTSIEKWMDKLGVETHNKHSELPTLKQGECLVVDTNNEIWFKKIKILPKNTFHPSPEMGTKGVLSATKTKVNISSFIEKLKKQLQPAEDVKKPAVVKSTAGTTTNGDDMRQLMKENDSLRSQLKQSQSDYNTLAKKVKSIVERVDAFISKKSEAINQLVSELKQGVQQQTSSLSTTENISIQDSSFSEKAGNYLEKAKMIISGTVNNVGFHHQPGLTKMLKILSMHNVGIAKERLALICGMSVTSGTFGVYYRQLKREGYFNEEGNICIPSLKCFDSDAARIASPGVDKQSILSTWYNILGESGKTKILQWVAEQDKPVSMLETGLAIGMSHKSGTFGVYYRELRRKKLIEINGQILSLSRFIF